MNWSPYAYWIVGRFRLEGRERRDGGVRRKPVAGAADTAWDRSLTPGQCIAQLLLNGSNRGLGECSGMTPEQRGPVSAVPYCA
jgi:hypothetical protein